MTATRIVFDASALLALVPGPGEDPDLLVRSMLHLHGLFEVVAPSLLASELGNVIHRNRDGGYGKGGREQERLLRYLLEDVRLEPMDAEGAARAFRLAAAHRLTAYDAAYLELAARDDRTPLVTEDKRLFRAAAKALGEHRAYDTRPLQRIEDPYFSRYYHADR
ncbi:MAG: type II toxin-antitoxin system VapC family toxin [Euryarchaeota archaeon]|nr:type II toxin-antitoxin system VapC family toxin [Euryarchaeota archaeon]